MFRSVITRFFLFDRGYLYISEKIDSKTNRVKSVNQLKFFKKLLISVIF